MFLTLIKARSASCTLLRNAPAHSQCRSRICRGCRSPRVCAIPTFSPEQWLPGPDTRFMLCHAGAGSDPALPGLWLRWDLPATMGAFQGPSRSLCKARLPEPCSPTPAGTATPLPLAPTQGNCCGSCSQGRASSHIPLKSRYARASGSCCPLHPSHSKPENVPRRLFHSTLSGKQTAGVTKEQVSDLGNPAGIPRDFLAMPMPWTHLSASLGPPCFFCSGLKWGPALVHPGTQHSVRAGSQDKAAAPTALPATANSSSPVPCPANPCR